ncbi:MAG: homoserine O-succinyltransferase [Coriobacteriia bacterium]|nr:homoserine O-succinyltransferase [Coriobacteriia bacterium]
MPVKIKNGLPAEATLAQENVFVMTDVRAAKQDIRPLHILVLNLMPTKETTETQLLRVLGNSPLQVEVTFLRTATYQAKHTAPEHLSVFYSTFDEVADAHWDGLIVTGAPVETLGFTEVDYWPELAAIFEWAQRSVFSSLFICWGAQAALFHYYGIDKHPLARKCFGVFKHTVTDPMNKLTRGFDDVFYAPHSRHTTVAADDIKACDALDLLAASDEAGAYLAASKDGRQVFVTGHAEYEADTLKQEYERDRASGLVIEPPRHYFLDDDPGKPPVVRWRAHADLLFTNWLNYCVYQETPYDLTELQARTGIE